MKTAGDLVAHAVREYREMTDGEAVGTATRARVLSELDHRRRWWLRARRLSTVILGAAIVGSGALALARIGRWTQPPPVLLLNADEAAAPSVEEPRRARRVIPAVTAPPEAAEPAEDSETRLYAAAHAAHFAANDPDQALAAWNTYLRRYPQGAFAPEARFNRAICLVRLRQLQAAASALAPFAAGRFGSYRRAEAQRLLDWLPQPALSAAPAR